MDTTTVFIGLLCKAKQANTPLDCRNPLGGPSVASVMNHDYFKGPFEITAYCKKCHRLNRVTLSSIKSIPVIEVIDRDDHSVEFKSIEDIFAFAEVRR